MIADWMTVQVLAVLFLATFVRSAFGFGEALVAVPLLALIMPVDVAAPVAVLISITVAVIVLAQDWRHVHARSAGWLVLSTLVGTPLGLFLLTAVPGRPIKACLGVIIVAFSLYSMRSRKRAALGDDKLAWAFGFGAGVLGGAYGMNGPPLVVYGALRGWSPRHFRATLQGYFLPASLMSMGGYWLAGLWKPVVTRYYLMALPAVLVAIFLGRVANGRMDGPSFMRYIQMGLVVVGGVLLLQSVVWN
ncbi:sulfite exporter TauE/SafE family protein [Rhodanobacter koreensis]